MKQNDQRPIARLDVMQLDVTDLGVALPQLGTVVEHQWRTAVGERGSVAVIGRVRDRGRRFS